MTYQSGEAGESSNLAKGEEERSRREAVTNKGKLVDKDQNGIVCCYCCFWWLYLLCCPNKHGQRLREHCFSSHNFWPRSFGQQSISWIVRHQLQRNSNRLRRIMRAPFESLGSSIRPLIPSSSVECIFRRHADSLRGFDAATVRIIKQGDSTYDVQKIIWLFYLPPPLRVRKILKMSANLGYFLTPTSPV